MRKFSDLNIPQSQSFSGDKIKFFSILNREIIVTNYRIVESKFDKENAQRLDLEIEIDGKPRLTWTGSKRLIEIIKQVDKTFFPFTTTIEKYGESYIFC